MRNYGIPNREFEAYTNELSENGKRRAEQVDRILSKVIVSASTMLAIIIISGLAWVWFR